MAAPGCSTPGCKKAGTLWVTPEVGPGGLALGVKPVPFCQDHGPGAGAERRCTRCGKFSTTVKPTAVLGHGIPPTRRIPGSSTVTRLLCPRCIEQMNRDQLSMFDD